MTSHSDRHIIRAKIAEIRPHPANSLFGEITDEEVADLARDIEERGLRQPVVVTPDLLLLSGHRRLRACSSLGWAEIDAEVADVEDERKQLEFLVRENTRRLTVSRVHRMEIYRLFAPQEFFEPQSRLPGRLLKELSAKTGISTSVIRKDLTRIRKPERWADIDKVRAAWNDRGRSKIDVTMTTITRKGEPRYIVVAAGRNCRYETQPQRTSAEALAESYKMALSDIFIIRGINEQGIVMGRKMKDMREAAGLNQTRAAARLDISQSFLSEIEGGKYHGDLVKRYYEELRKIVYE